MHRLRVLGGARLYRDGRAVAGRAGQRHPFALLALLAVAPRSTMSRDKLVYYLWPDHASTSARHRLSVALHVLRRELGPAALPSHGDAVQLDQTAVWTDVGAFAGGVADGRLEDAVRHYAGPFLDGFFLRGAPEFDPWVEGERARLAALFGGALEQLAREATVRGDVAAATALWKRLGVHAPYSSRVTLEVVRALERTGDRTGALRRARAHCALVTSDLGAEPDAEIIQLAARLASAPRVPPAPDGGPTSRRAAPGSTRR